MLQSLLCDMNKRPPQSPIGAATGGAGSASISMVSSISSSYDVVVVVVLVDVDGGKYDGCDDMVDPYVGLSVTVVDSMPLSPTSVMIDPASTKREGCRPNVV